MKNSELIKILQDFDGDIEVTTSDRKGTFSSIKCVELQNWGDEGKYSSVTLVLGDYSNEKCIKEQTEEEEFIDKVNENLPEHYQIDKEEAIKAKEVFEKDLKKEQDEYNEWFKKEYDVVARESMKELFENDENLDTRTDGDLKYYVYKNGWQDEIDKDYLNNRKELLCILYNKLNDLVDKKMTKKAIEKYTSDYGNYTVGDNTSIFELAERMFKSLEDEFLKFI